MKNLYDILKFYENIKQKDLFPNSVYVIETIGDIERQLNEKNKEFFSLIEKNLFKKDFGNKGLDNIMTDLSDIHEDLSFELSEDLIPRLENTPMFRYKIQFNNTFLTEVYSRIIITGGISQIYWYFEKYFKNEIELGAVLRKYRYDPFYVDEEGYVLHIYSKLINAKALEKDFYGYNNRYVAKINEFSQVIPADLELSLPIDCHNKIEKDKKTVKALEKELVDSSVEVDDSIQEKIFGSTSYDSTFVSGREILYPMFQTNNKTNNKYKYENDSVSSLFKEVNYTIEIDCSRKEKAILHLIDLFDDLEKIGLIMKDTPETDIISVFSGEHSDSKIIWTGYNNSIAYFIRQTVYVYGLFKFSSPKWEVVCFYFNHKKFGNKFVANKLKTNSSYKKTQRMDEAIERFRANIKSL